MEKVVSILPDGNRTMTHKQLGEVLVIAHIETGLVSPSELWFLADTEGRVYRVYGLGNNILYDMDMEQLVASLGWANMPAIAHAINYLISKRKPEPDTDRSFYVKDSVTVEKKDNEEYPVKWDKNGNIVRDYDLERAWQKQMEHNHLASDPYVRKSEVEMLVRRNRESLDEIRKLQNEVSTQAALIKTLRSEVAVIRPVVENLERQGKRETPVRRRAHRNLR